MRDAIKRAYATKLEAEAKLQASAPAPDPAKAITPPKPEKHWGSRDYPPTVRVAPKVAARKPRHIVSIPGRQSYER